MDIICEELRNSPADIAHNRDFSSQVFFFATARDSSHTDNAQNGGKIALLLLACLYKVSRFNLSVRYIKKFFELRDAFQREYINDLHLRTFLILQITSSRTERKDYTGHPVYKSHAKGSFFFLLQISNRCDNDNLRASSD